jgi:excisionase family DNA binding protein
MKRHPPEPVPLLLLTPEQACDACQVGRNQLEEWMAQPGFPVIRDGRVVRIPLESLKLWLAERASYAAEGASEVVLARLPTITAPSASSHKFRLRSASGVHKLGEFTS